MPIRTTQGTTYYLAAYDDKGEERRETDGTLLSETIARAIGDEPVTDVFIVSHGWRNDVGAAVQLYDAWLANLTSVQPTARSRPGFHPLFIGLHWPSEPWGNESISASFAPCDAAIDHAAAEQAERLCAGPDAASDLRIVYEAYATADNPHSLPTAVERAYRRLHEALGGESDDMPPFDPEAIFQAAKQDEEMDLLTGASFAALSWGSLLAPLRILSFWRMKNRARAFGEGAAGRLVRTIQSHGAAVHLMGHSFGCVVMSAAAVASARPVQSMVLVQGAVSLWAYRETGYFHPLIRDRHCAGPIVATTSPFDLAVGKAYPLAAGIARQESFAPELPKYGGIGAFGIQGLSDVTSSRPIGGTSEDYAFEDGRVYNVDAGAVISGNHGQHDAHSDFIHPEVAQLVWSAAQSSMPSM